MIETPSRILVVDDEPSITEFVSYALKKEGYETDVVDNGEDAFALASANNYDLFILDKNFRLEIFTWKKFKIVKEVLPNSTCKFRVLQQTCFR